METKKVIHIPERGCHNCRLHCVNHKECNSEYPCKQGMEWRPIIPQSETVRDDLKQYITNMLYYAYYFNCPTKVVPEFDKWVELQVNGIDEYFEHN